MVILASKDHTRSTFIGVTNNQGGQCWIACSKVRIAAIYPLFLIPLESYRLILVCSIELSKKGGKSIAPETLFVLSLCKTWRVSKTCSETCQSGQIVEPQIKEGRPGLLVWYCPPAQKATPACWGACLCQAAPAKAGASARKRGMPLRSFLLPTVLETSRTDFRVGFGGSNAKGTNSPSILCVIFLTKYSPLERFPNPSFFDS